MWENFSSLDTSACRPLGVVFYFITSVLMVFGFRIDIVDYFAGEDWIWGVLALAAAGVLLMWFVGLVFLLLYELLKSLMPKGVAGFTIFLIMAFFYPVLHFAMGMSREHFEDKQEMYRRMDEKRGMSTLISAEDSKMRSNLVDEKLSPGMESRGAARKALEQLKEKAEDLQPDADKRMRLLEAIDKNVARLRTLQPIRKEGVSVPRGVWSREIGDYKKVMIEIKSLCEIRSADFKEGELFPIARETRKTRSPVMTFVCFWFFVGIGMLVVGSMFSRSS